MMSWNSVSSTDSASSVRLGVSGEHMPLRMPRCKSACKRWRSAAAVNESVNPPTFGEDMNKSLELNFLAHPVRQYRLLMFTNTESIFKTKHTLTFRMGQKN